MNHYYETVENDGKEFVLSMAHKTFQEAVDYAEAHRDVTIIHEIGGCWDDFVRCEVCHEWVDSKEIHFDGVCDRCKTAAYYHGF